MGRLRDLNAELMQALQNMKRVEWARKTEFTQQPAATLLKVATRHSEVLQELAA